MQERFRIQCIHDMNSSISANLNTAQQRSSSVSSAPTCQNVQQHSSGLRCVSHLICVNRWLCFFSFSRHSHGHTLRPRHIFHFVLGRIGSQLHVDAIHGLVSKPYAHVSSQADRYILSSMAETVDYMITSTIQRAAHTAFVTLVLTCTMRRGTLLLFPLLFLSGICFFLSSLMVIYASSFLVLHY